MKESPINLTSYVGKINGNFQNERKTQVNLTDWLSLESTVLLTFGKLRVSLGYTCQQS